MNFEFSDDQRMLRDHARRFLGDACSFHSLRTALNDPKQYDSGLWQQMVEQGWMGVAIPEACGGMELGLLELCVLSEELGRCVAAVPFFATVGLGAEILKQCSTPATEDLLTRILAGEAIFAVQLVTPDLAWSSNLTLENGRVSGTVPVLAYAAQADFAIVPATENTENVLVLVDLHQPNVQRQSLVAMDHTVAHGQLQLDDVACQTLCRGEQARAIMTKTVDRASILMAFEQVGAAEAAMEMARNYALERYTFGRPIGSYQAVKHKLADMAVKIELARSNAYYGAWALTAGSEDELAVAAAAAHLTASEALEYCAEECLHLHGGIGYTWEADCHFFYNRARLLAVSLGNRSAWIDRLLAEKSLQALFA
ncbi:acyl-CoA dehydrogenase family protein [Pseudomonas sp. NFX15]|uniref:acyl-CoA dehydrogenase family protein n=1 Tax=Pseudomonas sp. NFX15 TaxID=2816958 RepID=UPI003B8E806B